MMDISELKSEGTLFFIEKNGVSIAVDTLGARVLSVNCRGEEILHYDPEDVQHSGIPLCFPNFGALDKDTFHYNSREYTLPRHGFIRDSYFLVEKRDEGTLYCSFSSNEETLRQFPFEFEFSVLYEVVEDGMKMTLNMVNLSDDPMVLAPGIHPYFSVEDPYTIRFNTKSETGNNNRYFYQETHLEASGLFQVMDICSEGEKNIQIIGVPDINLINHGLKRTRIYPGGKKTIILTADNNLFNRMTIWRSALDSPFICVEPSFKRNSLNAEGLVIKKGNSFNTVILIEIDK